MINVDSIWVSLGPLLFFNLLLLATVLVFRAVSKKRERTQEIEDRHSSKLLNRWMREYWFWLTSPIVRFFVKIKLTPNVITVLGVFLGVFAAYFFALGHFGLGGWLMIFGASFDFFDGLVARATNRVTHSGAYFDSVMDRVSEGLIFVGLAWFYRTHWALLLVLLAFMGAYMVSYAKARGDASQASYSGGSMQRPERIVYMGVGAVFTPLFVWILNPLAPYYITIPNLYLLPLGFVALMCWITTYNRITHVMKILDGKGEGSQKTKVRSQESGVRIQNPVSRGGF